MSEDEKVVLCEQEVAEAYAGGSASFSNKYKRATAIKSDMSLVSYDSAKAAGGPDDHAA